MDASTRTPHRPRRFSRLLRSSRITHLGVIETLLAIAITAFELGAFREEAPTASVIFAAGTVVLVAVTGRFPIAVSMLSLVILLTTFIVSGIVPLFWVFFASFIVEIVAARGQVLLAASLAVVQWLLSAVDPSTVEIKTDFSAMTIVGTLFGTAFVIGWSRANHGNQQRKLRASLAAQERQQRVDLARELHDSVATSLTSVVMQAQALTLLPPGDDDNRQRQGLDTITESSREALTNLRTMLQLLNEEPNRASFRARTETPPLDIALAKVQRELEAHSMEVCVTVDLPRDLAAVLNVRTSPAAPNVGGVWVDREAAFKVLVEMTSNAAKHSPRNSTVGLTCTVEDDWFAISMTNPLQNHPRSTSERILSGGMGVGSMRARAAKAGGNLETDLTTSHTSSSTDNPRGAIPTGGGSTSFWRTTLRLPIVVIKS